MSLGGDVSGRNTTVDRVLWIGTGSVAGDREISMLAESGFETVRWTEPGNFATEASPNLSDECLDFLSRFSLTLLNPPVVAFLKQNFSSIVVEEHPATWGEVLRVFPGQVAFRCYGLQSRASDRLWDCGVTHLMLRRRNFTFVPAMPVSAIEEGWVSRFSVEVTGSHVTSDDVGDARWHGPFDDQRPAVVIGSPTLMPDYDRRHRNFISETFEVLTQSTKVIDIATDSRRPPWLATLTKKELADLTAAAGLMYTDQTQTFIHAYALQAVLLGVPIIYLANSLMAKLLGGGAGQADTVGQAQAKLQRLVAGDRDFIRGVLDDQKPLAHRLNATSIKREFTERFLPLLRSTVSEQDEASLSSLTMDADVTPWLQTERLLASLLNAKCPVEHLAGGTENSRLILDCLFHVALQRDPTPSERHNFGELVTRGTGALEVMSKLLQSPEGVALWPANRMRKWLSNVRSDGR